MPRKDPANIMFGLPGRFGEDRLKELLHRIKRQSKRRPVDERPFREWRREADSTRQQSPDDKPSGEKHPQ
jgi:hypothetical protein